MSRIGIDLGGTKIESVLLSADVTASLTDQILERRRTATPAADGYAAVLAAIVDHVRVLDERAGRACAVGIGTPGAVTGPEGRIKNSNTPCLRGRPIGDDLSEALGRTVLVENDANCFALAETMAGAARGHGVVFGVILGTGVGGGIVLNGRVHRGLQGIAGEWGHSPIYGADGADGDRGAACYCGQRGCVETWLSGPGLERAYADRGGEPGTRADDVFRLAADGHPPAADVVSAYLAVFGEGVARVIHVLDPDVVVLGGGLSNADCLYDAGRLAVERVLFNTRLETPILRNQLGDSAGVIGAAWLAEPNAP